MLNVHTVFPTEHADRLNRHVELIIQEALEERRDLGLKVPESVPAFIHFCQSLDYAFANYSSKRSFIGINVLPIAFDRFENDSKNIESVNIVCRFQEMVREVRGVIDESVVQSVMQDPSKLDEFFNENPAAKEHLKVFFDGRGVALEEYLEVILSEADNAREAFNRIKNVAIEKFLDDDLNSIRHELDHLVYYLEPEVKNYMEVKKKRFLLNRAFDGSEEKSKELGRISEELLSLDSFWNPRLEVRAHFFSFVGKGKWKSVNSEKARQTVVNAYLANYVFSGRVEQVLDLIVSQYWAAGLMNRETSNVIYSTVLQRSRHQLKAARYRITKPEEIKYDIAEIIVDGELPCRQREFYENAVKASFEFKEKFFKNSS